MITATLEGIEARIVRLEIVPGAFDLGDGPAARETRIRVRSACASLGLEPLGRIGGLPKRGPADLAVAMLALGRPRSRALVLGELSLSGEVRPVRGVLPALRAAVAAGIRHALIPVANLSEIGYAPAGIEVRTARTLAEALEGGIPALREPTEATGPEARYPAWSDVAHLPAAATLRDAIESGARRILLVGVPGSGKTMLARRVPGILPPPTPEEAADIATIASAAGLTVTGSRPFRAPHHTASTTAIVGGGSPCRPGEATLAHHGVLFLDEIPEVARATIAALSAVLRRGRSVVVRASETITMPADPIVIAAMNPCPCGYLGAAPARDARVRCSCTPERIESYRARVPTEGWTVIEVATVRKEG